MGRRAGRTRCGMRLALACTALLGAASVTTTATGAAAENPPPVPLTAMRADDFAAVHPGRPTDPLPRDLDGAIKQGAQASRPSTPSRLERMSNVTDADADGIPDTFELPGWGRRPSATIGSPNGFQKWSYPNYPMNCLPDTTTEEAYEILWVSDASVPDRMPFYKRNRGRFNTGIRRASSVFAASTGRAFPTASAKLTDRTPRIVTYVNLSGECQPKVTNVTVPHSVYLREPYQNWNHDSDPATPNQMGIWPYLETQGHDDPNRRYVTIVDGANVWNHRGGSAIVWGGGSGYGPVDDRPSVANKNNADGIWMSLSTTNDAADWDPAFDGKAPGRLAHEFAHGVGGVYGTSPNANVEGNPLHPTDCADLLCYNNRDVDGQTYDNCGPATANSFRHYSDRDGSQSRPAFRLDCGRNDYWNHLNQLPSGKWNGYDNSFYWGNQSEHDYTGARFSNLDFQIPPQCTYDPYGYCPPGVQGLTRLVDNDAQQVNNWVAVD